MLNVGANYIVQKGDRFFVIGRTTELKDLIKIVNQCFKITIGFYENIGIFVLSFKKR
ncbi:MAG: hypothetical protein ACLRQF_15155 [Thomasclavelia ramosa]